MRQWKLGACMWGMPEKGIPGIKKAAELGLSGLAMDISLFAREDPGEQALIIAKYREAQEVYQVEFPAVSVEILNQYGLTRPKDSEKGIIALEACRKGIGIAKDLGVGLLQFPSFNDGEIRTAEDFRQTCDKIRLLCEEAAEAGIRLASENNLNLQDSLRMVEEVAADNFGLLFDTQNYYLNGIENTPELFCAIAPYVEQVHLKDGVGGVVSNALIGEGESGFFETAEAVRAHYRGEWLLIETYYDREPFSGVADTDTLVRRDIDTCRNIFA